jgi:subtilisin family serine protease
MTITRQTLLAILVALLAITGVTAPAAAQVGGLGSADAPETQTYDGNPSYIVEYDNGSTPATAIGDWANASDSRELIEQDNDSKKAVVAAPRSEVLPRVLFGLDLGSPLSDRLYERGYVQDIDINYRIERVEPVGSPLAESEFEPQNIRPFGIADPEYLTDGLAFDEDVNETALNVSRDATAVDDISADGTGQTIAVVDTGANTADGSLYSNGSAAGGVTRIDNASKNFITNESVNASASNYTAIEDGNGHGSWVASATAANATVDAYDGMAPNATLLVLKALSDDGGGSVADIGDAIRYAADNDADVISVSLGSPAYSEELVEAIDYAHNNGVKAVVVAAGNSRPTRSPGLASPADYAPTIAVGATNGSSPSTAWSAYFSQVGPDPGLADASEGESGGATVDVAAPGFKSTARIASTSGALSNDTLSGTSMATPVVSGAIAIAMDANSTFASLSHTDLHDRVGNATEPVPHAAEVEVGGGMVDADALATGDTNTSSQSESMTSAAQSRDTFYEALGGGGLFGLGIGLGMFAFLGRWLV